MASYKSFVKKADSLYDAKKYEESATAYQKAFDAVGGGAYPYDRYNAACSFALSGDTAKALFHLFSLAKHSKIKYKNYNHITTDPDLKSLYINKRWKKLIELVKANKDEAEKDLDRPLVAILDSIYIEDQKYRRELGEIEEKYGFSSKEVSNHWKLIEEKDSINLIKVKKILDERGWLGPKVVGAQGNSTLFLVIQHSDLETQLKYLPMMRDAVEKGNANASSLALLEDRVALRQGKRQIYGSQVRRDSETKEFFVLPLIEPEKVNERRAKVGLGSIEEYIQNWGMTWDVERHKERTKKFESEKEVR
ncbi:MAG: hypothetical protein CSA94_01440 [Bacteroidetes bacterium]|nr:MAG: hypothetical protein CSA94_01440 [Bacteroidota bacterium]